MLRWPSVLPAFAPIFRQQKTPSQTWNVPLTACRVWWSTPPQKKIVVNLENDNPVSEDPFFLVKAIEKVDSPWLRALPDFANTLAAYEEEYAYRGIDAMFGRAYNISHVKETEVGDGKDKIAHVDLARTFGIAKQHGYKGYFSMEWDSPGDPYAGTAGLIEKTLQNLS